MKLKILILFVVTIIAASNVVYATSVYKTTEPSMMLLDDDVPVWNIGDSWTYKVKSFEVDYLETGIKVYMLGTIEDFTWTVASTSGSDYTLDMTGKISADYVIFYDTGSTQIYLTGKFNPALTRLAGTIVFSKANLELKDIDAQVRGITMAVISPLPFPIPLPYRMTINGNLDTQFPILQFPIYEGLFWTSPSINIQMQATMGGPLGIISFPFSLTSSFPSWLIECTDETSITVQGNTYTAYEIEPFIANFFRYYYAPSAGNLVKIDAALTNGNIHAELVSTTYS